MAFCIGSALRYVSWPPLWAQHAASLWAGFVAVYYKDLWQNPAVILNVSVGACVSTVLLHGVMASHGDPQVTALGLALLAGAVHAKSRIGKRFSVELSIGLCVAIFAAGTLWSLFVADRTIFDDDRNIAYDIVWHNRRAKVRVGDVHYTVTWVRGPPPQEEFDATSHKLTIKARNVVDGIRSRVTTASAKTYEFYAPNYVTSVFDKATSGQGGLLAWLALTLHPALTQKNALTPLLAATVVYFGV